ncbi:hypothetical protein DL1_00070 [Thioclava dalianensis]|uniref:Uncharacterized protein n=1 Tax=Thioclava dalianensis TaxID=1185766 RepID=A0A074TJH0_9RHOB|nr:hypothetical protein DL1_00070 [Thioclava dalianensis]
MEPEIDRPHMKRGHFASLNCLQCGHGRILELADLPREWLDEMGWTIRPEILARMRCARCGHRGRPDVRFGWTAGKV